MFFFVYVVFKSLCNKEKSYCFFSIIISFNIIIIIKNIRIISINIHNTVFRIITIGFVRCTVNLN